MLNFRGLEDAHHRKQSRLLAKDASGMGSSYETLVDSLERDPKWRRRMVPLYSEAAEAFERLARATARAAELLRDDGDR